VSTEIVVSEIQAPKIWIPENVVKTRDDALELSKMILSVNDAEEQRKAVAAMTDLRSLRKRMESSRVIVKEAPLTICKAIDAMAKDFSNNIENEESRLNKLTSDFQRKEAERVEKIRLEEEAKRKAIFEEEERKKAELQKKADAAKTPAAKLAILQKIDETEAKASIAVQDSLKRDIENTTVRVAGMVVRKPWTFKVLDINELYKARPDLCVIEPNNTMIRGMITGGVRKCAGLEIYQEFNTGTRSS
jgi:hypothetical protein